MAGSVKEYTLCYHCGQQCEQDIIVADDKSFCCTGCHTVYDILQANNLCTYYDLEKNPGANQKNKKNSTAFAFLDNPEMTAKLLDFQEGNQAHVQLYLPQVHCSSCIWLLESLHRLHAGILQSRVHFSRKTIQLAFDTEQISLREVVELLSKIGYEPALNLSDLGKKKPQNAHRKTWYQLGVAGFCFGNIMLFSFPEYFSYADFFHEEFASLFGWLNFTLGLPVVLYSAQDYFRSAWWALRQKGVNMDVPISAGILALFIYSTYEIATGTGAGYFDSLAALLFFLLLGKIYQQKTYDTLSFERDYTSYFPIAITRLKGNKEESVALPALQVGDRILVRNGELIPADGILYKGEALIDYSFVTGEAVPVSKTLGEIIYAGGSQQGAAIELEIVKEPSQSYLTDLWNHEAFHKPKQKNLATLSDVVSTYFTFIVLGIALVSAMYWIWQGDLSIGIKAFSTVLIVACPCALALSTPFTLGNSLRILGRNAFYLKNAEAIERMAQVDTLVFDKTGTLSETHRAQIQWVGEALHIEELAFIKSTCKQSSHPLSVRIYQHLEGAVHEVHEFTEHLGKGVVARTPEFLLRLGSREWIAPQEMAVANAVWIEINGQVKGYFRFEAQYREGLEQMIQTLQSRYDLHVLSGDNNQEEARLRKIFGEKAHLRFNQSPADKLAFIESLQAQGKKVMMIGDGLNDAGALQKSEVGISVTENINQFSPACDAIISAPSLRQLPDFLRFSHQSRNVIKASFALSFAYNIVGLSFAVQGLLSPVLAAILMPLSSVTVVVFTTLLTNALAMRHQFLQKKPTL
ncbi:heavy metal translocating P-type ATPase metal-binding domain-containing protein [Cytophagales bacterium LB-30]|uniref:Heavy metal translocating P-type ATPase metal-binding domain-containing protein n=1 Tax=Shiella aurantiaca TaxID=3058365 RepID=A0ABT8F2V5_9BACT|nr:heavy metal translocating P-type ATPase metal-binding domain-containing protein [Shiella aurantiaca]MDN4164559.1 heavy metal translocating P-type ATPase metal-binding domain-containing protein [Shiella aurantiaca]